MFNHTTQGGFIDYHAVLVGQSGDSVMLPTISR